MPPGTFDGAVVLVTGGGTGLGKAIAGEFRRLGASVAIASRKAEHLEAGVAALEEITPVGSVAGQVFATPCDLRDPESISAAFDAIEEALGLPGVLINNAAANFPVPAEDMSPNAWRTVVDITLNGTFFVSRELARRHLAVGTPASIVDIGASYAWTGGPGFAHSAAAKAGVKNMVESLAVEWGPYGIQVNGLVPGLFPHDDMTADIRGNLDRTHEKDRCQPALRVGRLRELGLGRHVPGVALRPLHQRPHPGGRRRQLAAPHAHQPAGRDRPRADGSRSLRALSRGGRRVRPCRRGGRHEGTRIDR